MQDKILRLIKRRINYHYKHFNRYSKECEKIAKMKYISKANKRKNDYSYEWMCRHLDVADELRLLKKRIKGYANVLTDETGGKS